MTICTVIIDWKYPSFRKKPFVLTWKYRINFPETNSKRQFTRDPKQWGKLDKNVIELVVHGSFIVHDTSSSERNDDGNSYKLTTLLISMSPPRLKANLYHKRVYRTRGGFVLLQKYIRLEKWRLISSVDGVYTLNKRMKTVFWSLPFWLLGQYRLSAETVKRHW